MALGPQTGDSISPVPVVIGERLWGFPWGIPDLWIFPTVFYTPINGLVARPYRAWSHGHVGSCDRVGSCDWSRGAEASKGSHDETCDRFPGSCATKAGEVSRDTSYVTFPGSHVHFLGSRRGIFVFTIWL